MTLLGVVKIWLYDTLLASSMSARWARLISKAPTRLS
jgi:hypothetical protein